MTREKKSYEERISMERGAPDRKSKNSSKSRRKSSAHSSLKQNENSVLSI